MQIPKNVVQTGEVDPCHKIYIEDYVNTFLTQYRADSADFCLYGEIAREGENSYYFVYGAAREEQNWEVMEKRYFSGQKRIGEATFDGKEAWLFFEDGYAAGLDGFFIFYEQNEDMQSYLIAMHQNQPGEKTVEVRPRASRVRKLPASVGQKDQVGKEIEDIRSGREKMSGKKETSGWGSAPGKKDTSGRKRTSFGEGISSREGISGEEGISDREHLPGEGETLKEPRRIHRRTVYAQEKDALEQDAAAGNREKKISAGKQEKIMHAAAFRNSSGRGRNVSPFFPGRVAGLSLLLVLCVIGVISISRYQEMREAGNLFAGAARELDGVSGESRQEETESMAADDAAADDAAADSPAADGTAGISQASDSGDLASGTPGFLVEETGIGTQQETVESAFPVFQAAGGGTQDEEATAQETETLPDGEETTQSMPQETDSARQESVPAAEITSDAVEVQAPAAISYTVKKGDNLAAICRRQYGNTDRLEEVVELNQIADPNRLIPGQKILLPN